MTTTRATSGTNSPPRPLLLSNRPLTTYICNTSPASDCSDGGLELVLHMRQDTGELCLGWRPEAHSASASPNVLWGVSKPTPAVDRLQILWMTTMKQKCLVSLSGD